MSSDARVEDVILVATDFSTLAVRATDVAADLAKQIGASLLLVHVFEPTGIRVPELRLDPGLDQDLYQAAAGRLAATAASLRARGLVVEERLATGSPPAEILAEIAATTTPSLVVLGSHGLRPVTRVLMGSVAEGALLRIEQPVLVVPEGRAAAPRPARSAAQPWRIAVGIDLSNSSMAAIDWTRELRARVACDVTFIHVYWPAAEYTRFGLTGPRDLFEPDPLTIDLLRKSLDPMIQGSAGGSSGRLPGHGETSLRIVPNWGSTGERLIEEATKLEADLLVLGTHHRRGLSRLFHGSTLIPAIHAGALPVVCVSGKTPRPHDAAIPPLRSIVAATDFSELGNRAIGHACALARGQGGVVHLLHVHERVLPRPSYAYASDTENVMTTDETNILRGRLMALVPSEVAGLGIATDATIVDGGGAAEVICQTAERLGADAICIASHGRGGLGRLVLGSVTARVLHQSSRPVFVVRHSLE